MIDIVWFFGKDINPESNWDGFKLSVELYLTLLLKRKNKTSPFIFFFFKDQVDTCYLISHLSKLKYQDITQKIICLLKISSGSIIQFHSFCLEAPNLYFVQVFEVLALTI